MTLKEIRKICSLTQKEAADKVGLSLRTYVSYETNEIDADELKLARVKEILLDL